MLHKLSAVWQLLRREGFRAAIKRLGWYLERWCTSDRWWIERLVELRGSRA